MIQTTTPNFHQVSQYLYRSAQPSQMQFQELSASRLQAVINLRFIHSDKEWIEGTGLQYFPIPCNAFHPETEDAVKFLQTVEDKANHPILVHCEHGSDRTGTMVALYRIIIQEWSLGDALHEMTGGPFGFHRVFFPFIWAWFKTVDFEGIKRRAFP